MSVTPRTITAAQVAATQDATIVVRMFFSEVFIFRINLMVSAYNFSVFSPSTF